MKRCIAILGLFFLFGTAEAGTYTASDCSLPAVQSAVNKAIAGDTVLVPSGSCTWSGQLIISKDVDIRGEDSSNPPNIEDNYNSGNSLISITNACTNVGYLNFIGGISQGAHSIIKLDSVCNGFNFHNMTASNMPNSYHMFEIYSAWGLINNVTLTDSGKGMARIFGRAGVWTSDDMAGSENAVYIENCKHFHTKPGSYANAHEIYAERGARYVYRYNYWEGGNIDAHGFAAYSQASGGGTRWYEIYGNTFHVRSGQDSSFMMNMRGGTGAIYNNKMIDDDGGDAGDDHISLKEYRVHYKWGAGAGCGDVCAGSTSSCDPAGYPALDQIGRGKNQALSPLYIWNNTYQVGSGGTPTAMNVTVNNLPDGGCNAAVGSTQQTSDYIQRGRDYFVGVSKPGYVQYTYPHPLGISPYPLGISPNYPIINIQ